MLYITRVLKLLSLLKWASSKKEVKKKGYVKLNQWNGKTNVKPEKR